uniref:Adaptor related protein complex 3 subunit beta 2 n=1 Tax=Neolamprologus brichardi TaxID=32507 RepID=A0A3Q4HYP7_NEOBR
MNGSDMNYRSVMMSFKILLVAFWVFCGFHAVKYIFIMFSSRRHDDLKEMLDSNKDSLKLEAMKRIVAMIARGKNASDLFPAVVKNVACKNIEVKKLVYVYLVRYAEEQQDLALLSISTFQRGLKDPNQLIRASALRVLSSIRVTIIVPIMMLAIKEAASDMSPYVRKTTSRPSFSWPPPPALLRGH